MNTSRPQVSETWMLAAGILLVLGAVACNSPTRPAPRGSEQGVANRSADPLIEVSPADENAASDDPCSEMFSSFFVEVDSVSYEGYEVVRLQKTVRHPGYNADIPVTYAILKSDGRTIATFEGVYFGAGNQTGFGFASVLGVDTRQLLVSQTIPRGGRHWIVDLSSNATTVFDCKDWDLDGEDVCIHDFDDDGVQEISLAITNFWGFGPMSMAESPMPAVVFKYDGSVRRYLPDKNAFARGMMNITGDVQAVDPNETPREGSKGAYLAVRLDIFLRYVYAGRENDAWSFFEQTYNLPDKEDVKREIKRILNAEPVYRYIYGAK